MQGNDISYIGDLLKQNHYYLQEMGVSNPELDRIVNLANLSGAEGGKMSGAGWGGIAIAVLKQENTDKFISEMKSAIFKIMSAAGSNFSAVNYNERKVKEGTAGLVHFENFGNLQDKKEITKEEFKMYLKE